jgi:non-lysosomal glucosylceramidase
MDRRDFIVSTSAALVGATARPADAREGKPAPPPAFRSPAGSVIPYRSDDLFKTGPQRTFTGDALSEIAFPLGGIGTGTVSLGGRGQLRDFEIFNRPAKGRSLPFTFAALWARAEGEEPRLRAVEAALRPPFAGSFGFPRSSAQGLPRLPGARFTGAYPFARIDFEDPSLPVLVSLEAFNPFVPHDVPDSSLPVAIFHYRLRARGPKPVEVALAFSLLNAVGYDGKARLTDEKHDGFGGNLNTLREETVGGRRVSGFDMTSSKHGSESPRHGTLALLTTHETLTALPAWKGGEWFDAFQNWINAFREKGRFPPAEGMAPTEDKRSANATLAPYVRLAPGQSATITFVMAWHFPSRENDWNKEPEVKGQLLRNDYARRFSGAWEVALHTAENLERLEGRSRAFHDAFFSSTLPAPVLDAASSQASIIRSNTCLLLENERFFGFEGCGDDGGCCPMNCTHVWNYEQALAFLFPSLERTMRETDFLQNTRPDGSMAFRTLLPLGRGLWPFRPAADGQMGSILKLYREWQISGDDEFLRRLWPQARRALEFAWTSWDADRDGVMEGEQHNTYDIEFYGPNPMMGTLYLGALRAGARMAEAVGDQSAARVYEELFAGGRTKLEELWNGDFYVQRVPPVSEIQPAVASPNEPWHAPSVVNGQVRYQYGDGCLSDQLLGEWFASVVGLAPLLAPDRVRATLGSIYRSNFRHDFFEHPNAQRLYALEDEKGLLLCSWPKGGRPALPFVYADEVWTGIEYQVAAHLVYSGQVAEGLALVRAVRDRYDGRRRNPWNEVECGSHYARALSSWSLLLALSGFSFSAPAARLGFAPRVNAKDFRCYFTTGGGWGVFSQKVTARAHEVRLEVRHGEVRLRTLGLRNEAGLAAAALTEASGPGVDIRAAKLRAQGEGFLVDLGRDTVIPEGQSLALTIAPSSPARPS